MNIFHMYFLFSMVVLSSIKTFKSFSEGNKAQLQEQLRCLSHLAQEYMASEEKAKTLLSIIQQANQATIQDDPQEVSNSLKFLVQWAICLKTINKMNCVIRKIIY